MICTLCHGRKTRPFRNGRSWTTDACGRCGGTGTEPELSLRELRDLNQQRIRRERYGNS